MKKTTATTALAATIGLSAWTMTAALAVAPAPAPSDPAPVAAPAEAALPPHGYACGPEPIAIDRDAYDPRGLPLVDPDGDGIICEPDDVYAPGEVAAPEQAAPVEAAPPAAAAPAAPAPATGTPAAEAPAAAAPAAEGSQVEQVPVGGADTGVSESPNRTGLLAGGGALAALAGAGLLLRRARQH